MISLQPAFKQTKSRLNAFAFISRIFTFSILPFVAIFRLWTTNKFSFFSVSEPLRIFVLVTSSTPFGMSSILLKIIGNIWNVVEMQIKIFLQTYSNSIKATFSFRWNNCVLCNVCWLVVREQWRDQQVLLKSQTMKFDEKEEQEISLQ